MGTTAGMVAAAAICVACIGGASPAMAKPVEHFQYVDQGSSVATFCGEDMPMRFDFTGSGIVTGRVTGGTLRYMDTAHIVEVYTNLATGRTITNKFDVTEQDLSVTNNGDGTLSIIFQSAGHGQVYGPDGEFLGPGAGSLRHLIVIDYGGTLNDPSDDTFISETRLTNHGPLGVDICDVYRRLTA